MFAKCNTECSINNDRVILLEEDLDDEFRARYHIDPEIHTYGIGERCDGVVAIYNCFPCKYSNAYSLCELAGHKITIMSNIPSWCPLPSENPDVK